MNDSIDALIGLVTDAPRCSLSLSLSLSLTHTLDRLLLLRLGAMKVRATRRMNATWRIDECDRWMSVLGVNEGYARCMSGWVDGWMGG